jgi:murein L,D-transpeptidase YcbB/YkuD
MKPKLQRLSAPLVLSLALAFSSTLVAPVAKAAPSMQITGFAQAVAEAAAQDSEIAAFYRTNGYQPIWTGTGEADTARRAALLQVLESAGDHGLPLRAYDIEGLKAAMRNVDSQRAQGRLEVRLSQVFLLYARHIDSGVVDPQDIDKLIKRDVELRDRTELLTSFVASEPGDFLDSLVPDSLEYARLMREKLRLEALIARGGWGPTVQSGALRPGDTGRSVVALRDRLTAMGYLARSATMTYDGEIQSAVQRFQADHGLEADGVAGSSTIRSINVSAETRLESILVAMERERWVDIDYSGRHVFVNLTDFHARVVDDGKVTFESRTVIGANAYDRRSPEFSDVMEHIIINPYWNVPRSIAVGEYLPGMIESGGASAGHLELVDGAGRVVPRGAVDWAAVTPGSFPYDLRQPPSNGNALGIVKFMFPNPYNVYLHDTPSKHLFAREERAFSHGCIRLQRPVELAYHLLAAQSDDPQGDFAAARATGREFQINLEVKIPVHLIYRTALVPAKGPANFRNDVYGRDAKIFSALVAAGLELPALRG